MMIFPHNIVLLKELYFVDTVVLYGRWTIKYIFCILICYHGVYRLHCMYYFVSLQFFRTKYQYGKSEEENKQINLGKKDKERGSYRLM